MAHDPGPLLAWTENDTTHHARWLTADDRPPPSTVRVVDDRLTTRRALTLAAGRHGLLWRGDYHRARQVLDAMRRRSRRPPGRTSTTASTTAREFHRLRQHRAHTAGLLGSLLVELDPGGALRLRRAPETAAAVREVHGEITEPALVALRELLGVLNVHRQRREGIPVAALGGARIHPHYGVFAPTRQDYLDLVARAPLPARAATAFDIGTGTGVLAALLIARGVGTVTATDTQPRAIACARDNLERLGLAHLVDVQHRDLFPPGRADLVVANPPWLPGTPAGAAETGVYDRHGVMTRRFLRGVNEHLNPDGEAWLVQSTLAEHLGLRHPDHIPELIDRAGLRIRDRHEIAPNTATRRRTPDGDPLAEARHQERLRLWRLGTA
jgi:methylase of polypeptide subunit release factors